MKKTVKKEVKFCDACGQEGCLYECIICGKHYCYECFKIVGVKFNHSIYCSGTGDGEYCLECSEANENDPLIQAYKELEVLGKERDDFYEDFKTRSDAAENKIDILFKRKSK